MLPVIWYELEYEGKAQQVRVHMLGLILRLYVTKIFKNNGPSGIKDKTLHPSEPR